ncbi:MAG: 4-alpha-glucanotransferase [Ruminococcaceae bacterium]|nr:4-alpha-glucanotransferase [Oscillospiraceae bacterium]
MRKSGVLLHISSLPSPYGIGTVGKEAYKFVDFLKNSGQSLWQILPICPTGYGDSPYQSFSSFAGNPYFIDLDMLVKEGLLQKDEIEAADLFDDATSVNYEKLYENRFPLLRKAYDRFAKKLTNTFMAFCREEAAWLDDYALFMALKNENGGKPFEKWDNGLKFRHKAAIERAERRLGREIGFYKFLQFKFTEQWEKLKAYANKNGVKIIGDLPIYVARDSADVWTNPKAFLLDKNLSPKLVAGCPPDAFSADGQLWGNPIYNWQYQKAHGYDFWCKRIARQMKFYDVLRIDHFRGFESFYAIPAKDDNARGGEWKKGPGMSLFNVVKKKLGELDIIAEDLGFITPEVAKLLKDSGYPGMKVLQFAFDSREESNYLPHTYKNRNSVVYVGTHDNDTAEGWMLTATKSDVAYAKRYLGLSKKEGYAWGFIRGAAASVSDIAIYTMQDLLSLGSEARMNTPSVAYGNWRWRMDKMPTKALEKKLYQLTADFFRLVK